ncbi:type IV secretion system protein VirB3 [Pseudomonas sp. JG-B]|uniref:type IV secretion system protein VirB3 n=1 Tax=Pseudomonas sp. JG-B TaxID=2603214 RepID=UPI00129E6A21|nr:type IV secretion system protein VirB3 [Pseudomonas sp. JG-B]MRK19081.1 conjugal transfer protein [Pseudomonas sp. JG-B]
MESTDEELTGEPLFVGLTRPATILGIPYEAFVIELMAVTISFLAANNPLVLFGGVPIHGILYLISANDPAIFGSFFVWAKIQGRCQNRLFWTAASFSPLRMKKWPDK